MIDSSEPSYRGTSIPAVGWWKAAAPAGQPFGAVFSAFFYAKEDGEYVFTLDSDTGAMLFLHDIRVINEPLKNPAGQFTGSVRLQAGWHPLRLYYRHAGDAAPQLNLSCQNGNAGAYPLTAEVFRQ